MVLKKKWKGLRVIDGTLVLLNKHHLYFQVLVINVIIDNVYKSIRIPSCDNSCPLICIEKNKDMPRMKRWSGTKKLKLIDVNKIFSKTQEAQPPRNKMSPSDDELTSCYYMSFQEYVYGERKSVPSLV
uniref:Uncharacterized protein n=1 Tax=Lactuca sativa TaxID=4236 RepID=A0A9R1UQ41_LACSA|nr:hypothetical protein LSAT_V11C800449820 [Lactuca sativa]